MSEQKKQLKSHLKFQIDIKEYKIIKQLQSGGFGLVYSVQNIKTNNIYAAKVVNTNGNEFQYKKMINREIGIMIRCQHPTIIKFTGYSLIDFNNQKNVTIFMELAQKGSLADFLNKSQKGLLDEIYDNTIKQIILVGIARGMMFLHQHQIIHRDLKPGNILLDNNLHPHITDFGLSKFSDSNYSMSQSQQCGTSMYMAPEIIEGNRYNGKVDVYSFGILMYEVITNLSPYPLLAAGKMSAFSFNKKVVDEDYRPKFDCPINKSIQKLIEKCWAKNPKERPTFEEIFKKLAYNISDMNDDIYVDIEESDTDEEPDNYFLEDIDVNEVISYANDIDNPINPSNDEPKTESQSNSINEIIEKVVNPLKKENEEIKSQIASIQKEKNNEINNLLKEINELKEKFQQEKKQQAISYENSIQEIKDKLKKQELNHENEIHDLKEKLKEQNENMELINNQPKNSRNSCIDYDDKILNINRQINGLKYIINCTSSSYVKEHNSYEKFNSINGELQTLVISNLSEENKENKNIQNIYKLLNFLSKELSKIDFKFNQIQYIYIKSKFQMQQLFHDNNEIIKYIIPYKCIEMLIENEFNTTEFVEVINNFDDIYIELNYPSNEYQKIYNGIINIKQSAEFKLKIDVTISNIEDQCKSFQNNKYINSIKIQPSVKKITGGYNNGFFQNCYATEIIIPDSVILIDSYAFSKCTILKKIIIPSSVKTIKENAFSHCSSLSEITIPSTVEYIGEFGFANCVNLNNITIDPFKTKIETNTFDKCINLHHLILPSTVNEIKSYDFDKYWTLYKITIPTSVTLIGPYGFSNCSSLKEINIPSSIFWRKLIHKMLFSESN